ncbi:glutamate synthase subunit beta [Polymorphobacter arshaanensis]|uniref:Glutamate synthase subunit beta n=1 Tax=Glacieibacterium arshaanense TaxID=2511025 RepID=A0A4Y9EL40_9SPHN|nr:glutamate synthase subunit beta [Polymorphobacter arshaanensis]TFU01424.1 glutamate synthase subunit beta [Polymorphobacter arshaanensis]
MGKPTGFLEIDRRDRVYAKPQERLKTWNEFVVPQDAAEITAQASRCMDCGIPFCHTGCPVNNLIPDWNDLVYRDDWQRALETLHSTNNFPEFTGRICPAPCEAACTLNIQDTPVTIKTIECEIIDRGWAEGWIKPQLSARGTGKRIAIVGSGPAGLACAQELARMGHNPTVFEKNDRIGGLLRYGIPDFKMEKHLIDRRVAQMEGEGVIFRTNVEIGVTITVQRLLDDYDLLVLAGGAERPRDLEVPGRDTAGVHFAMEFLMQQNRRNAGDDEATAAPTGTLSAKGKHVVVIGGGDTGSDCIGTSNRHGAASVTQLEVMPAPPVRENKAMTWPNWPLKMRTSSSQEEGCERDFAVLTKSVISENGKVAAIECVRADWRPGPGGQMTMQEVPGSSFQINADLVLLAMGFLGPRTEGLLAQAGVEMSPRGAVAADFAAHKTSADRIFSCGDMRRGQSLVVWAIREGRECAQAVDAYLSTHATMR